MPEPSGRGLAAPGSPLPVPGDAGPDAVPMATEPRLLAQRRRSLTEDALPRVIRRVALPAVASNLLMTLFGSVDAFWVGTHLGATSLAAVTTSLFWIWLFVSVAEMVSVGLTAVAARRHGEGRSLDAARAAGDALLFALALGAIVAALGLAFLPRLFAMMGTPPDVGREGARYLGTYLLGAPLIFGYFAVDATFRASGDTRRPLLLLATSVAVTLLLDPVLILGWFGVPALGIVGAAVATVATRSIAFALGVSLLVRRGMIRFGAPRPEVIATIARVGAPTAATGVLFSLIYVALTRTTTHYGTSALAALGLGFRVESWLYMLGVGFGAAAAAIIGQNLGAGHTDRAARAGWIMVAWASVPGVLMCITELLIPERLAGLFTVDPAVIAVTAGYLRIAAISQAFVSAEVVLEGALGGAGDTVPPMLTSTVLSALRIPLAVWAGARFGLVGVWWTISLTACARAIAMAGLWRWGRWKRKSL